MNMVKLKVDPLLSFAFKYWTLPVLTICAVVSCFKDYSIDTVVTKAQGYHIATEAGSFYSSSGSIHRKAAECLDQQVKIVYEGWRIDFLGLKPSILEINGDCN